MDCWALILYDLVMTTTSEILTKAAERSISAAARAMFLPESHTEVPSNSGGIPVTAALEPPQKSLDARCLWCGRTFKPRSTGGIGSEVLLHGTPTTILDRGASLDDEGDRRGPNIGRLLEGVPHERARCLRGIPIISPLRTDSLPLVSKIYWRENADGAIMDGP